MSQMFDDWVALVDAIRDLVAIELFGGKIMEIGWEREGDVINDLLAEASAEVNGYFGSTDWMNGNMWEQIARIVCIDEWSRLESIVGTSSILYWFFWWLFFLGMEL